MNPTKLAMVAAPVIVMAGACLALTGMEHWLASLARAPDARSQTDAVDQAPPENDARHAPFADLAERLRDRK